MLGHSYLQYLTMIGAKIVRGLLEVPAMGMGMGMGWVWVVALRLNLYSAPRGDKYL